MRDRSVYYENRIAIWARRENGHSDSFRLVPKDRITEEMLHRNRLRRGVALSTLLVALMLPYNWIMGAVVGISMGKVKSRRADSNRLPLLITSALLTIWVRPNSSIAELRPYRWFVGVGDVG
jgi:hypothetical protein